MALPILLAYIANRKYRPASKLRGLMRVGGYVLSLCALGIGFSIHSARASLTNVGFQFGEQLRPLTEQAALSEGTSTRVVVNGEQMSIAESVSTKTAKEILDLYETECSQSQGPLTTGWDELAGAAKAEQLALKETFSSFKAERNGEAFIFCFTKGSESRATVREAINAFGQTHDLGAIGRLRYAYITRTKNGRSKVLTAWTGDHFNFDHIAPRDGSEPFGTDPAGLPKIPNSQRVLEASLPDTAFAIHAYKTDLSPEAGLAFYNDFFKGNGWDDVHGVVPGGIQGKAFAKNGNTFIVSSFTDKQSDKTLVAVGTMGNPHLVKFQ